VNVGVTGNIAMKDSKTGYDFGPYGKFVTNKNSFIKIGVDYASGDWEPSNIVYYTPGYWTGDTPEWAARTDAETQVYLDFVWNF